MPAENHAAKLTGRPGRLEVAPAAYPTPEPHQIIVANAAVAINPVDWIIQISRAPVYSWVKAGAVLGTDVAGVVAEVGSQVSRFAVGDRVLGFALGTEKDHNDPAEGAFQLYTAVLEQMAAPIPGGMSFPAAAVLPLGVSTAACGLFQSQQLGMQRPSIDPTPTGETLLVWGGATSVGTNAIQLARAAGYDVITTCSPRNDGLVRSLGASASFDYHRSGVVAELTDALKDRRVAGRDLARDRLGQALLRSPQPLRGQSLRGPGGRAHLDVGHAGRPSRAVHPRLPAGRGERADVGDEPTGSGRSSSKVPRWPRMRSVRRSGRRSCPARWRRAATCRRRSRRWSATASRASRPPSTPSAPECPPRSSWSPWATRRNQPRRARCSSMVSSAVGTASSRPSGIGSPLSTESP